MSKGITPNILLNTKYFLTTIDYVPLKAMADYTVYATPATEWLEFEKARGSPPHPQTLPNREDFNATRAETFRRVFGQVGTLLLYCYHC